MEFTFLELEKIYRQTDPVFIELLNKIRNKTVTGKDLEAINRRAAGDNLELPERVIYLTTNNAMAEKRNEAELDKLPGKRHYFTAEIGGEVDKKYFPASEVLQLKESRQVWPRRCPSTCLLYTSRCV